MPKAKKMHVETWDWSNAKNIITMEMVSILFSFLLPHNFILLHYCVLPFFLLFLLFLLLSFYPFPFSLLFPHHYHHHHPPHPHPHPRCHRLRCPVVVVLLLVFVVVVMMFLLPSCCVKRLEVLLFRDATLTELPGWRLDSNTLGANTSVPLTSKFTKTERT